MKKERSNPLKWAVTVFTTQPATHRFKKQRLKNKHENIDEPIAELFQVVNATEGKSIDAYNQTTEELLGIVREKAEKGKKLRALGSVWSLSDVVLTQGTHVDTTQLNLFMPVGKKFTQTSYPHRDDKRLFFAQCGVRIRSLHKRLLRRNPPRSLRSSGSSDGQTIAGALSTGTHGSAIDESALQDAVVGIHLITGGPDGHVWLERDSYPVMNDKFVDLIGAKRVPDDDRFNAALVSFGCCGLIHGVLLETVPVFTLEMYRRKIDYDDVAKAAIRSLDFSGLDLPKAERPYHMELTFNPNDRKDKVYAKVIYKKEGLKKNRSLGKCKNPGADGLTMIELLFADLGGVWPISILAKDSLNEKAEERFGKCGPAFGTLGEIFGPEPHEGPVISSGLALPTKFGVRAVEIALEVYDDFNFFPGLVSLRFARKSPATLAFTRFQKTCVLEIDGLRTPKAESYMKRVFKRVEDEGIPCAYHWGKDHRMTKSQLKKAYGTDLVEWKEARKELLPTEKLRKGFSSDFTDKLGLTT